MRSHHGRPETVSSDLRSFVRSERGFSMVELLVTIVLAGIIFAAMVPFFANALQAHVCGRRAAVDATNIAVRTASSRCACSTTMTSRRRI